VLRGWLERGAFYRGIWWSGSTLYSGISCAGNVAGCEYGVRIVPAFESGRGRGDPASWVGRAEEILLAENDFRRMDRYHEPDRTAGGLGSWPDPVKSGKAGRWQLQNFRPEDFYHICRA